jgi:hypothetical protein
MDPHQAQLHLDPWSEHTARALALDAAVEAFNARNVQVEAQLNEAWESVFKLQSLLMLNLQDVRAQW